MIPIVVITFQLAPIKETMCAVPRTTLLPKANFVEVAIFNSKIVRYSTFEEYINRHAAIFRHNPLHRDVSNNAVALDVATLFIETCVSYDTRSRKVEANIGVLAKSVSAFSLVESDVGQKDVAQRHTCKGEVRQ